METLELIRTFREVAGRGSFSTAARSLDLSNHVLDMVHEGIDLAHCGRCRNPKRSRAGPGAGAGLSSGLTSGPADLGANRLRRTGP